MEASEIGAITLFSLNNLNAAIPVIAVHINVSKAKVSPPDNTEKLKNSAKFIPAPNEKAKNGIRIVSPGRRNSEILGSKLPNSIPIPNGSSTDMNDMTGKVVPINPSEIRVSKGPSLIANIDSPPISERFPYALVNAAYIPLLLFVIAAIIAIVDNPNNPVHGSKMAPSNKPTPNPEKYLVDVNRNPFFNAFPPDFQIHLASNTKYEKCN